MPGYEALSQLQGGTEQSPSVCALLVLEAVPGSGSGNVKTGAELGTAAGTVAEQDVPKDVCSEGDPQALLHPLGCAGEDSKTFPVLVLYIQSNTSRKLLQGEQ